MVTTHQTLTFILLLIHVSEAKPHCTPSACGIIPNISSPFRLNGDPNNCGDHRFQLGCENNVTSVYLNSHKYYVKAINYGNSSIRLVDASINIDDICSFPAVSAYHYNFTYNYRHPYRDPYLIPRYSSYLYADDIPYPVHFVICPNKLKNPSLFTDISTNCASSPRYTYIKVGHLNASEVPQTCELDLIVITSWRDFKNLKNVSLSEIHHSLLYGFELTICSECRTTKWERYFEFVFMGRLHGMLVILLVIAVLLSAGVGPPLMIIIVFTGGLGYLSLVAYSLYWGNFTVIMILVGVICAPRFIIFHLAFWFLIYKFRRRHLSIFDAIECFLRSDNKLVPVRYSYSDIKKMTKGFREKLGEGGYGSVYKGKLRSGTDVAVKLLGKSAANGLDFMNEIATIGRIHHVNVVKLVGYCAERSKRALVYDFMPNGSLEKYIFNQEKMNFLNWDRKFDIAMGVARGIEYLHRDCDIQILHFDIKPHNVLLDDNFIPKISDFGLAKYFSTDKNTVSMTAARGTIGYVAPELISRSIGAVSYKADVYSFGMLLMEMVGFKRELVGKKDDSSKYFPYWIYDCFNQGKDIDMGNADEMDDNDSTRRLVRKMAIVALWCIQMNPDDRPSMNKVLEMLETDVEHLHIPEYPSESTQNVVNTDQIRIACSSESLSLLHHDDASQPSVEITVQE